MELNKTMEIEFSNIFQQYSLKYFHIMKKFQFLQCEFIAFIDSVFHGYCIYVKKKDDDD